ncbi:MAG: hypothetical protein ABSC23_14510 [Bryobacteraceae bacterium]|jgi:hypothetical protein
MNFKGIQRRIQKLAAAPSEASVACQAEEALRHWRETGEFSYPDGRPVPIAVYQHIIAPAAPPEQRSGLRT